MKMISEQKVRCVYCTLKISDMDSQVKLNCGLNIYEVKRREVFYIIYIRRIFFKIICF